MGLPEDTIPRRATVVVPPDIPNESARTNEVWERDSESFFPSKSVAPLVC